MNKAVILFLFFISIFQISYGQTLEFVESISEDSLKLELINFLHGPVSLQFESLKDEVSMRIPNKIIVEAQGCVEEIISIPLSCIKDTSSFSWKEYFTSKAQLGDPNNSKHNKGHLYDLPYKKGASYTVLQGWNGKFSHRSKKSKYAIDFKMPIGDTICAARKGTVVRTEDKYSESGGKDFIDMANQIVILHVDGTLAFYVHLKYKGVLINQGDEVIAGQPIGLSGNTGYSTKPHLHFVVREAPDKAVPIYFKGYEGQKLLTKKGYKNQ